MATSPSNGARRGRRHPPAMPPAPRSAPIARGRASSPGRGRTCSAAGSPPPSRSLLVYLIVRWAIGFIDWAFINAIWSVPVRQRPAETQACRDIKGIGACWAVITEKHRFILFGTYPYEEHWRPALVCVLFVGLYVVSAMRRFWNWRWRRSGRCADR